MASYLSPHSPLWADSHSTAPNFLPVISLFCGAGGLDFGFRQENFRSILACDNDAASVRTYNFNAKRKIAVQADLATIKPNELLNLLKTQCPGVRPVGILGGPPCQGFSQSNVYADPNDPRNTLPFKYAELLKAVNKHHKIKFFVFENVKGLTSAKHSERLIKIKKAFRAAGFNVFEEQLNARHFGVPQSRPRLFLVGLNADLYANANFSFPSGNHEEYTIEDAIGGLPEPSFYSRQCKSSRFPYHPNHWTMAPKSAKFGSVTSSTGRSFRLLSWDKPSPTVAYGHREIHIHPSGVRRLSIYEAMLLQGFPSTYRLLGTLSEQVTQVSNAVPPPVARALAKSIKAFLRRPTFAEANSIG